MKATPSATVDQYILQEWKFGNAGDPELDELSATIRRWARPGKWLDLGCGPLLTIWPMFANCEFAIVGCDRHRQIAEFHADLRLVALEELPPGLRAAVGYCNSKFGTSFATPPIESIVELVVDDITKPQHRWFGEFSTVVQIGCFGCLDSKESLKDALSLVERYLRPGGVFISETWVPQPNHKDSVVWGGDALRDLSVDTFVSLIEATGMVLLSNVVTPMQTHYRERIMLVAEKRR